MFMLIKLGSKNQITVPADIIKKIGLHEGSKLE
ncbi:MAG: AbrB/MazE/SpoVT family DNA-binding domain-containing protein, partial [Bacillota bacterium]